MRSSLLRRRLKSSSRSGQRDSRDRRFFIRDLLCLLGNISRRTWRFKLLILVSTAPLNRDYSRRSLVAASLTLMGYERCEEAARLRRIDGGQDCDDRPISAKNAKNHAQDCGTADQESCEKCAHVTGPCFSAADRAAANNSLYPHLTPVADNN